MEVFFFSRLHKNSAGAEPISAEQCRVARFLFVQYTKAWKNAPNDFKITKFPLNISNGCKTRRICNNIYHSKVPQNIPELVFLVRKEKHLATLVQCRFADFETGCQIKLFSAPRHSEEG
jgi:hypothetical protein